MSDKDKNKSVSPDVDNLRDADAILNPEVQGRIGRELRRTYADLVAQPLPDKLSQLLEQLAQTDKNKEQKS